MIQMALAPSRLNMPMDAATQKFAFLGRTGTGKSYAASKLAEQLLLNRAQIVALDPVGIWYGLRIGADGKSPGIAIPVFGGLHSDVPLESTAGALIADLIIDRGISAVVDVSQFESDAQKCRFASDFASRLFYRKKSEPGAIMIFLEEAQEFIPQNPEKNENQMLHAFSRMCKIGRNFGIGAAIISQRPQEINKKVLNMTECMFSFQMTGPQERETIKRWVQDKGADLDIVNDLPRFQVGECHVWSQQWLKVSKTVKIAPKQTFNASSTPQFGSTRRHEPNPLQPAELETLRKAMAETIERAERDDPATLRKRIAQLEAALKTASATPQIDIRQMEQRHAEEVRRFRTAAKRACEMLAGIPQAVEATREFIAPIAGDDAAERGLAPIAKGAVAVNVTVDRPGASIKFRAETNGHRRESADSSADGRILRALAMVGRPTNKRQLGALAGVNPKKSTWRASMASLKQSGMITINGDGIELTDAGRTASNHLPPIEGAERVAMWKGKFDSGANKLFQELIDDPGPLAKEALSARAGIDYRLSTWRAAMAQLRAAGFLIEDSRGFSLDRDLLEG